MGLSKCKYRLRCKYTSRARLVCPSPFLLEEAADGGREEEDKTLSKCDEVWIIYEIKPCWAVLFGVASARACFYWAVLVIWIVQY